MDMRPKVFLHLILTFFGYTMTFILNRDVFLNPLFHLIFPFICYWTNTLIIKTSGIDDLFDE